MFDRKHALPWLVALSMIAGAFGQMLVLSAAPHPSGHGPSVVVRRLAVSLSRLSGRVSLPKTSVE